MSGDLIQLLVMGAIFLTITIVGSVALYRAGRPGWWLPILFMLILFGWPLVRQQLG